MVNSEKAFPNMTNQTGMDLRDYFAAKAMDGRSWSHPDHYAQYATACYKIADAMMKARGEAK